MERTIPNIPKIDNTQSRTNLAKKSFKYFFKKVLENDLAAFHTEMVSLLDNNKIVFLAPRGHGKSELLGVAYPIWKVFGAEKPITVMIVSSTEKQAVHLLERIKEYIDRIPMLQAALKPKMIHSTKWAGTEIKCQNHCEIKVYPLGTAIRHEHVDLAVCDDILRDDIGTTAKTKKLFYEVVLPTVDGLNAQIIVVGTPQSYIDLLSELGDSKQNPNWISRKYKAITQDKEGKKIPLFPERFSLEKLKEIKSTMGSASWSKEYMCEPISSGSSLFPWGIIEQCIDKKLLQKAEGSKNKDYFIGCDVALSEEGSADYSVFIVGEQGKEKEPLEIVRIERYKGKSTRWQIDRIKELHQNFLFRKIMVEQKGVSYDMAKVLKTDPLTRTVTEGFNTSRTNKEKILSGLEIIMQHQQIKFPRNDILLDELMNFGVKEHSTGKQTFEALGKHDDCVIALALMVEASKQQTGKVSAKLI